MRAKLTTKEFVEKSKIIHNNKYDYSLSNYINSKTKIKIICPIHGEFEQLHYVHINRGSGCKKCSIEKHNNNQRNKFKTDDFIKKSISIHKNKYDYSKTKYTGYKNIVTIICPEHGEFNQISGEHLRKRGCNKCGEISSSVVQRKTNYEFIKKSINIHGNNYDYSNVNYVKNNIKVKINCPEHGEFLQTPHAHTILKHGCPFCKESKGEREIRNFLNDNKIKFIREKTFVGCKNKQNLPFDFYLPEHNACIEYDGEQHFKPLKRFGGKEKFLDIQKRDKIKDEYCKNNNIHLLRIKYNQNIIYKLKLLLE